MRFLILIFLTSPAFAAPEIVVVIVRLGGRRDLRLHFLVSAGLEIVADSGLD